MPQASRPSILRAGDKGTCVQCGGSGRTITGPCTLCGGRPGGSPQAGDSTFLNFIDWATRRNSYPCTECRPLRSGQCVQCAGTGQSLTGPCLVCSGTGICPTCNGTGEDGYSLVDFLPDWLLRFFKRRRS